MLTEGQAVRLAYPATAGAADDIAPVRRRADVTVRIGIDFGAASTVVARWDENRGTGVPVPLDGIDLSRAAGDGVTQRVIPSLIAYSHQGTRRWVGAQVSESGLLADPGVGAWIALRSPRPAAAVSARPAMRVSGKPMRAPRPRSAW